MYLHIGKEIILNTNNIIAILDIETLEKKEKIEDICKKMNISDNIIDVSNNNKKSLIIVEDKKNKFKIYISNISSSTLEKRTNESEVKKDGKI